MASAIPRPGLTGVLAMALAAALIAFLVVDRGGAGTSVTGSPLSAAGAGAAAAPEGSSATTARVTTPSTPDLALPATALTVSELQSLVQTLRVPVYWVGERPGISYELSRSATGDVTLRYLPAGVAAGAPRPLLTVGTYPYRDAFGALKALTKQLGTVSKAVAGGGIAVYRTGLPRNVYVAYPGVDLEIEIFSPSESEAHQLSGSRQLRVIGA